MSAGDARPRSIVLKVGGSVLAGERGWANAVACVRRERESGARVLVVVSATRGTTDALLADARRRASAPDARTLAHLLACGEETAAALLGLSLDESGVEAEVRDGTWLGLAVRGDRLEAEPVGVDAGRLDDCLARTGVLVVPGFIGRHVDGGPALLGRGGSDLSAVFLAARLGAPCRLVKDVDGLFTSDPRDERLVPDRYVRARWSTVLERGRTLVQPRAIRAARVAGVDLSIIGPRGRGTRVGDEPDLVEPWSGRRDSGASTRRVS